MSYDEQHEDFADRPWTCRECGTVSSQDDPQPAGYDHGPLCARCAPVAA